MSNYLFDRASFYYKSCSSTNDIAKQYISNKRVAEGTVFIADYQCKGRGQRGNHWHSAEAQNLLFSLVLYPEFLAIKYSFSLNIIISLSIYEVLARQCTEGISIKWPNDIYYLDKKIGGILIETSIGSRDKINTAIIGIGLNINQVHFDLPNATSLALIKQTTFDRGTILNHILQAIGNYYAQLHNGKGDLLWSNYLGNLYRNKEVHCFKHTAGYIAGRIVGVNRLGQLLIEMSNGNICSYDTKEITFVI
ncbi:biotin--[acetyl-CoA-carboxylase] ligase [Cardinium endosymbiont of Culicoides punctatus]|uniref:biotin--[acetyl-CoA-carboxylase] ligase n=1 Tax=Cardinium endosymbiont of Culicoides punctatus TaxID=2304601 RepID=UPI001058A7B3|nr:biotin--[acetyl-CoA-carboxylase] ligase [Cardinium endosymbiont of Culicoides punctatus]TDG95550.1 Bifunctional ligase/repressor BirA [Cardinium endosymbiont of Culicoides punctatus]